MALNLKIPSPIERIEDPLWEQNDIELFVKRDDLIHPIISGNKWRKLKLFIEKHQFKKNKAVLSFGGAYSNHLVALAAAGSALGIPTIGIVRGEELNKESNTSLKKMVSYGMELKFVSRSKYQHRSEQWYWEELNQSYGPLTIVPEGGLGFEGMMGACQIVEEVDFIPDFWLVPVGTGTTLAGVLWQTQAKVIAFCPFSEVEEQKNNVKKMLEWGGLDQSDIEIKLKNLEWVSTVEYGSFGKLNVDAADQLKFWFDKTKIPMDGNYNGKMWLKLIQMMEKNYFKPQKKIIFLHTGGIQGNQGVAERMQLRKWW